MGLRTPEYRAPGEYAGPTMSGDPIRILDIERLRRAAAQER